MFKDLGLEQYWFPPVVVAWTFLWPQGTKIGAEVVESSKVTEVAKEATTAMDPAPDNTEVACLQAQTPKGQLKDAPSSEDKDESAQTYAHAKAHKKLEAYNNEIENLKQ